MLKLIKFTKITILLLGLSAIVSCGGEETPIFTEEQLIEMFIQDNQLPFERTASGLRYHVANEGIGDLPQPEDKMEVFIQGFSLDNRTFTNNFGGTPFVIDPFTDETSPEGLIEGLKFMRNKGQYIFLMTSDLGYGSSGNGVIEPNSPVGFLVEIGCLDNTEKSLAGNAEAIEAYLDANDLIGRKTDNGLYYTIEEEGDGEHPSASSNVTVNYRGYLLDGTEFDSSAEGNPANFPLSGVIRGWQEGIPLFSRGGKGKLFVPHDLGYGCYPPSADIPPLGVLIFDVELLDF